MKPARGRGPGPAVARSGAPREEPDGVALFEELSRTVVELAEEAGLRSFALPYAPAAQRALDRTVLHCLGIGEEPPKSLPELLEWCRFRPASDPLFGVPPTLVLPEATLVHPVGLMPTRACLELASAGAAGGLEETARVLLAELEGRCGSAERYRRSRRFLALNPVVHRVDRFRRGWSKEVWARVKELYRPVPESLTVEGTLLRCGTCRLPALLSDRRFPDQGPPVSGPQTWCEGESCPQGTRMELIRDPGSVRLLCKPLRAFFSLPFQVEQAVLGHLDRAAISYQALPGELCAYRLHGAGLRAHELHVYDRVEPALLADRFAGGAAPALVVVPEALAGSVRYRDAFIRALAAPDRVLLSGPRDLAAQVRSRTSDEHAFDEGEERGEANA